MSRFHRVKFLLKYMYVFDKICVDLLCKIDVSAPIEECFCCLFGVGISVIGRIILVGCSIMIYLRNNYTGQQRFCSMRKNVCFWCNFGR